MSTQPPSPKQSEQLYDTDTAAWASLNAELLRQRRFAEVDVQHLIEELEDMGKSERRALESHLSVLLMHLLKWAHQPSMRSNSWRLSIENACESIRDGLDDSPSLRPVLQDPAFQGRAYSKARRSAAIETGLDVALFPLECPFDVQRLLSGDLGLE
jgi:hypothetical protein